MDASRINEARAPEHRGNAQVTMARWKYKEIIFAVLHVQEMQNERRNEDGSPVDWWFLYMQPRWADKGRQEPVGNGEGDTYVYASSARNYEWKVGATVVNSSTCLLGKNLEGIYDGTVENFVFYNDQLPNGSWTRRTRTRAPPSPAAPTCTPPTSTRAA